MLERLMRHLSDFGEVDAFGFGLGLKLDYHRQRSWKLHLKVSLADRKYEEEEIRIDACIEQLQMSYRGPRMQAKDQPHLRRNSLAD
jgi:hypothetical protein